MDRSSLTRRGALLSATAAATLATSAQAASPDQALDRLYREADACQALRDRIDGAQSMGSIPDDLADEWETRECRFLRVVEALPATRANAAIKARAVTLIYSGDLNEMLETYDGGTTDIRLVAQIIAAVAGPV